MFLNSVEKLLFYILFIGNIIFYPTTGNILWKYLNTFFKKLIKIDQNHNGYSFEYSTKLFKDRALSNYLIMNSNFNFQFSTIFRKFSGFYFKPSKYYRKKRKIVNHPSKKWNFPIVYEIERGRFNDTLIDEVIKNIQNETCIRFVKRNGSKIQNYPVLKYFNGYTCTSPYGRTKIEGVQSIILTKLCQKWKSVIHETLHAMGLLHEQSREDRYKYVEINWSNILKGSEKNFVIINPFLQSTYNVTYDYGSIMHYDAYAFSKNRMPTIIPNDSIYLNTLGSSLTATFNDFKILNLHYCGKICNNTNKCENGGYPNPKNCSICKCPEGFRGTHCKTMSLGKNGNTTTASKFTKEIIVKGSKSCIFHINATENKKIEINLYEIIFPASSICNPNNCLEVKYKKDLTVTGARICKELSNYTLISEGSHVIIFYRSINTSNTANIKFHIYKKKNPTWEETKDKWKISC